MDCFISDHTLKNSAQYVDVAQDRRHKHFNKTCFHHYIADNCFLGVKEQSCTHTIHTEMPRTEANRKTSS
jgi:hypothetical protein